MEALAGDGNIGTDGTGIEAGTCPEAQTMLARKVIDRFYDAGSKLRCVSSQDILAAQIALKGVRSVSALNTLADSVPEIGNLMDVPSACWMMKDTVTSTRGDTRQAFQGGALTECVLSDFLARTLRRQNGSIDWCDDVGTTQEPRHAVDMVLGRLPKAKPRYVASIDDGMTLVQLGGPLATDCALVHEGTVITIEIKDKVAKAGEFDLLETEDGKLVVDGRTRKLIESQMPNIMQVIDDFNARDTTLAHIGHNVKLDDGTQRRIFHDYLRRGDIDLILTFSKDDKPILIDAHDDGVDRCICMGNGEIRTAGRNSKAVYTPDRLMRTLESSPSFAKGSDGTFSIRRDDAEREGRFVRKRGGTEITRLRIGNVFFVFLDKVVEHDGLMSFNIGDVRQLKPTVSAHISCPLRYDEVRAIETGR